MHAVRIALASLLLLFIPGLAHAQAVSAVAEESAPPPRLRQRDFTEATLHSRAGLEYRLLVSVPRGPAPEGGFPVFYVLDGDAFFNTAVEITRMREWGRLTPSIVVGIAYPSRAFYDGPRRNYDFTTTGAHDPNFDPSELGGAENFLAFLTNEVKAWVAARHQIDADREVLFGHSMGGLFVLHAMFTAPRSFDIFLAASPTMQFADRLPLREARAFERHPDRGAVRALITVGGLESSPPPQQVDDYRRYFTAHPEARDGLSVEEALQQLFPPSPIGFHKARETRRLAQRLARSGVDVTFAMFEGDEHLPAGVTALLRGVPFALRPATSPRRVSTVTGGGVDQLPTR